MTELSIVIVTYNTKEPLRRCLQSINVQRADLDLEVIVVDNYGKDGTGDMVRDEMPSATFIDPGKNTWFTGGNNLGVSKAIGDYVLILNPDTVIQPGTLQHMLASLRDNPNVGALTCRMVGLDGSLQYTCSRVPRYVDLLLGYTFLGVLLSGWRERRRAAMWYRGWERDSDKPVEVIPDSNMMSPRDLLNRIDTFDESLKLYFTEDDICKRILDAGYEVHFTAGATLLHEEHASTRLVQRTASQVYFDDLIVFCRKWYGGVAAAFLQALVIPTRAAMDTVQRLRGERTLDSA